MFGSNTKNFETWRAELVREKNLYNLLVNRRRRRRRRRESWQRRSWSENLWTDFRQVDDLLVFFRREICRRRKKRPIIIVIIFTSDATVEIRLWETSIEDFIRLWTNLTGDATVRLMLRRTFGFAAPSSASVRHRDFSPVNWIWHFGLLWEEEEEVKEVLLVCLDNTRIWGFSLLFVSFFFVFFFYLTFFPTLIFFFLISYYYSISNRPEKKKKYCHFWGSFLIRTRENHLDRCHNLNHVAWLREDSKLVCNKITTTTCNNNTNG